MSDQRLRLGAVESLRGNPAYEEALKALEKHRNDLLSYNIRTRVEHSTSDASHSILSHLAGLQAAADFLRALPYNETETEDK